MKKSVSKEIALEFGLWLRKQFHARKEKNSNYSLRAFAQKLDMDPSSLSQIMNAKRNISTDLIRRTEQSLDTEFLTELPLLLKEREKDYQHLPIGLFPHISHWYYIALLEMTLMKNFSSDLADIAERLNISEDVVRTAVQHLKKVGLLSEHQGILKKTKHNITNYKEGETSDAHKTFQKQILHRALEAVDKVEMDKKDITSMIFPMDVKKVPYAKKLIKKFRKEMNELLDDGNGTEVYALSVQLVPLTT
ncbi:TIGR02147 family protein [Pseudobdellovibrio exovorus]|uniref:HTH cro/C1-type domain-containing protein n=1 Tax=Pseudobdellovibrio exovorus JSS TaxID=1184267 RepID=M4VBB3_9BACT|nr:TIGR02147 family protein [Pseudobdellovibrio exovorus]AGH95775.1 hypothetical protein A11Q_1559 [Pseudobdellovibrio exovorus JSS]